MCVHACVFSYSYAASDVLGYYMGYEVSESVHDAMAVQIPTAIPIGMYRKGQVIIGQPSMLGPNINCIRGTERVHWCAIGVRIRATCSGWAAERGVSSERRSTQ